MVITPEITIDLVVVAVVAVVMILTTAVAVVVASVIVAALVVGGASSPFRFFGVGVPVCYFYQFADGCVPLAVQLSTELLVPEPFGEGSDGLGVDDVGNGVSCL